MTVYATKHYMYSYISGMPVISGTAGALIAALDALLINGFNSKTVTSLSRTGTTATLNATSHGFSANFVIEISGVENDTNWNGEYIVNSVPTTGSLTFTVPDTLNDTPTGATITVKYPKISSYWVKAASGTNKAIYKSTDPQATGYFLRVDDSNAKYAIVSMTESYTDVDNGLSNTWNRYWHKSDAEDSNYRNYLIVGDSKRFYLMIGAESYQSATYNYIMDSGGMFGDILSTKPGDAYHCILTGSNNSAPYQGNFWNTSYMAFNKVNGGAPSNAKSILRSHSQLGTQQSIDFYSIYGQDYSGYNGLTFPNMSDNGICISNVWVAANGAFRGIMPGLYSTPLAVQWALNQYNKDFKKDGKTYMWFRYGSNNTVGGMFFDVTYDEVGWTL